MRDRGLVRQPGVAAAQAGRHPWVAFGEPLDVHLVDDRVGVAAPHRPAVGPVERPIHDDAARYVPGGIQRARLVGVVHRVAEHLRPERDLSADLPGVRIEQQFRRVATQATGCVVRARHAISVSLPGADAPDEAIPDARVIARQREPGLGACAVEQAQRHRVGHPGRHGEVRATGLGRRAQREWAARQHAVSLGTHEASIARARMPCSVGYTCPGREHQHAITSARRSSPRGFRDQHQRRPHRDVPGHAYRGTWPERGAGADPGRPGARGQAGSPGRGAGQPGTDPGRHRHGGADARALGSRAERRRVRARAGVPASA